MPLLHRRVRMFARGRRSCAMRIFESPASCGAEMLSFWKIVCFFLQLGPGAVFRRGKGEDKAGEGTVRRPDAPYTPPRGANVAI